MAVARDRLDERLKRAGNFARLSGVIADPYTGAKSRQNHSRAPFFPGAGRAMLSHTYTGSRLRSRPIPIGMINPLKTGQEGTHAHEP
jgi:hypothetical protein